MKDKMLLFKKQQILREMIKTLKISLKDLTKQLQIVKHMWLSLMPNSKKPN